MAKARSKGKAKAIDDRGIIVQILMWLKPFYLYFTDTASGNIVACLGLALLFLLSIVRSSLSSTARTLFFGLFIVSVLLFGIGRTLQPRS